MFVRLTTLLLVLAAALPAVAQAEPVARPGAATQVREHQGILVFSRYDATTREYRLAIRRPGAAAEDVPVAPADRPFNADIGPDSAGRPQLVYERCPETCELFVSTLAGKERAVRNANDPERPDVAPTIWKGRIAWARIYGEQRDRKVVVYTKRLTAPRSQPSQRLPGAPERRCGDFGPRRCVTTGGRTVRELELWGDNLAQTVTYDCTSCSGIAQHELRLVDLGDRTAKQIAFQVVGLGGQQLIGPSFHGGRLGWYKACLGDPEGCGGTSHGPWRYGLRYATYSKGRPGPVRLDGFVDLPQRQFRVEGCSQETQGDFNATCRIEEVTPEHYVSARRPGR